MAVKKSESGVIELRRLEDTKVELWVIGTAPIIMHKWSEKALRLMPGNPLAEAQDKMRKKGLREPEAEAEASVYRLANGQPGFPSTGFKASLVSACRFFDKPSMTEAKLLLFVEGQTTGPDMLVPIFYEGDPQLRTDAPRLANGGTDLRYRYQFYPWWACLHIRYVASSISPESVVALVDAAGRCGVGDWRPSAPKSSTGTFGTWRLMTEEEKGKYHVE